MYFCFGIIHHPFNGSLRVCIQMICAQLSAGSVQRGLSPEGRMDSWLKCCDSGAQEKVLSSAENVVRLNKLSLGSILEHLWGQAHGHQLGIGCWILPCTYQTLALYVSK